MVVTVEPQTGEIVTGPEIITRGWVYAPEAETLLGEATEVIRKALTEFLSENKPDLEGMRRTVRQATQRFVNDRTRRKPMIVPVIMEV